MIDIILTKNTREEAGGHDLSCYVTAGVFLAVARKGLEVRYIDQDLNLEAVPGESQTNIFCYAVYFGNKTSAFHQMQEARRLKTKSLIIAFGQFAAVFSDEILMAGLADIVVSDDPEFVIPELLERGCHSNIPQDIPNVSYMQEGKIVNSRRHLFEDLDKMPFVSSFLYSQGYRPGYIMSVRGCAYHCIHCDRIGLWRRTVRQRSVGNVLEEMEALVREHQPPHIYFLDENFMDDHKRLIEICKGIRRIKGRFQWSCTTRIDVVNQEILSLMANSRCSRVSFGAESASRRILRSLGKTYGPQDIINAVNWSRKAGLTVRVRLMTGIPGETDADRDLTSVVLDKLKPITVITNRMIILPGSPIYNKGLREGWFTKKSFFEDDGVMFCDEVVRPR